MKRIFIVGCPRSGTTLLQTILAAHPSVLTFRESHFFDKCFRHKGSKVVEYASAAERLERFLLQNELESLDDRRQQVEAMDRLRDPLEKARQFIDLLDAEARHHGALAWAEKTPDHVFRIRLITQLAPKAMFLHLVRPPVDVVVSLRDATKRWGHERPWIRCWVHWYFAMREAWRYCQNPQHCVVPLEQLARNPQANARQICDWLELPWDEDLLLRREQAAEELVLATESWKSQSRSKIEPAERKTLGAIPAYLRPLASISQKQVYDKLLRQATRNEERSRRGRAGAAGAAQAGPLTCQADSTCRG